ncbi:uncharacterized protein RCC_09436 [Ramularia collo-cygni]|uniref:Uncharacterized protein n=1 Tax=Ramularia collo-cygni TaxID=112498 RepID=A0A2D3VF32_9PEZI|nr:uncharacterized protein RCC_09436 [Ramularia collo-cygni]CZT23722.1 uncharacterized protein RCC_09436 [Ramularia collo-cygni]
MVVVTEESTSNGVISTSVKQPNAITKVLEYTEHLSTGGGLERASMEIYSRDKFNQSNLTAAQQMVNKLTATPNAHKTEWILYATFFGFMMGLAIPLIFVMAYREDWSRFWACWPRGKAKDAKSDDPFETMHDQGSAQRCQHQRPGIRRDEVPQETAGTRAQEGCWGLSIGFPKKIQFHPFSTV